MTAASVNPVARIARVEAGALWQDVVPQAAEHGMPPLLGSSPDVGVVGYSLGGGIGYLGRKHGIAANSVTAIELVTADGQLLRADPDNDPELFWALRGGGGNFGVVTAMEFRALPDRLLYAGMMLWPAEDAARVYKALARLDRDGARRDHLDGAASSSSRRSPTSRQPLQGRHMFVFSAAYTGDRRGRRPAGRAAARARPRDGHVRPDAAGGPDAPARRSRGRGRRPRATTR